MLIVLPVLISVFKGLTYIKLSAQTNDEQQLVVTESGLSIQSPTLSTFVNYFPFCAFQK
jgi:hypothetical protein